MNQPATMTAEVRTASLQAFSVYLVLQGSMIGVLVVVVGAGFPNGCGCEHIMEPRGLSKSIFNMYQLHFHHVDSSDVVNAGLNSIGARNLQISPALLTHTHGKVSLPVWPFRVKKVASPSHSLYQS